MTVLPPMLCVALACASASPTPPQLPDAPPATAEETPPAELEARTEPEAEAPPGPKDADVVTVRTPEGERTVDLQDESSWEGLSVEAQDRLRAERARRLAQTQPDMATADPPPPTIAFSAERGEVGRRDRVLREVYEAKERRLVVSTAVLGGLWGVFTITSIAMLASRRPNPTLGALTAVGSSATGIGTIVSGAMLGAHRNTRPLYFAASPGGMALRF